MRPTPGRANLFVDTYTGMAIKEPIRIISDLHLGHPSSSLADPAQLLPLLSGPSTVIFNGDSVEIHLIERRKQGFINAAALKEVCAKAGTEPCFINGNHDPNISEMDHADLADGSVLVTHGDMLFHSISPWNRRNSRIMGQAHTEALKKLGPDDFLVFEKRLHASKHAALAIEMHKVPLPRGKLARVAFVVEEFWPPWRPFQIFKCWWDTPAKADALARTFRPQARFVIIGHTHRAGIWRVGERVVINTGSLMPFAGSLAIDIADRKISVKKIVFDGRQYTTGREIAEFEATQLDA